MGFSESYNNLIDSLEEKGFPEPRIVLPILFVALLLIGGFFVYQFFFSTQSKNFYVLVKDSFGNPIIGASVTLSVDGDSVGQERTDSNGRASFTDVKVKSSSSVRALVSAMGYENNGLVLDPSKESHSIVLTRSSTSSGTDTSSKIINFLIREPSGAPVAGAKVLIILENGSSYDKTSSSSGIASIDVKEIPLQATVRVFKDGYESPSVRDFYNSDLASGRVEIVLSPKTSSASENKASLRVKVLDEESGEPISGITVVLNDYETTRSQSASSSSTGFAVFNSVFLGKNYYINAEDSKKVYESYSGEVFSLSESNEVIEIKLSRKTKQAEENKISIQVKDSSGEFVSSALVMLFVQSSNQKASEDYTDDDGLVSFDVDRRSTYYVTVYKEGYLPVIKTGLKARDSPTILLEQETDYNSFTATILVKEDSNPAPNAEVFLYRSDGFALGIPPMLTEADGKLSIKIPSSIRGSEYSLFATASLGSKTGRSNVAEATNETILFVFLEAPKARVTISLKDFETNSSIKYGVVSVLVAGNSIASYSIDDGSASFEVASGIEFALSFNAPNYLNYISDLMTLSPKENRVVSAFLYPASYSRIDSKFLGFYKKGKQVSSVLGGEVYQARFSVTFPAGVNRAGFNFRVGGIGSVENYFAGIKGFSDVAPVVYSSISYDNNCTVEVGSEGSLLKWVELQFPSGTGGTRELSFDLFVKPEAQEGLDLVVYYRAYSIKNGVLGLSPSDEAVSRKYSNADSLSFPSDLCSARSFSQSIKVSSESLSCSEGFCESHYYEDDSGKYSSGFTTRVGKEFSVKFSVYSEEKINYVSIKSDFVKLIGFKRDSTNLSSSKIASFASSPEQRIPISIPEKQRISFTASFKALRTGAIPIEFVFNSVKERKVSDFIEVTGTNPFKVIVSPIDLQIGSKTRVVVKVQDGLGNSVKDAQVALYDCEGTPLDGQEPSILGSGEQDMGEDGRYSFYLTPSSIGKIGVKVKGNGYASYDSCLIEVLSTDFIEATPDFLLFEGDSSNPSNLRKQVSITSLTNAYSTVSTSIKCVSSQEPPLTIFPNSFNLRKDKNVYIDVNKDLSLRDTCVITFYAKVNSKSQSSKEVTVSINLRGTSIPNPSPIYYSPTPSSSPVLSPTPNYEEINLPSAISFSLTQENPQDIQTIAVSMPQNPLECKILGFNTQSGTASMPSYSAYGGRGYSAYGNYPYGGFGTSYIGPSYGGYSSYPGAFQYSYPYNQFQSHYTPGNYPSCQIPAICYNPSGCPICNAYSGTQPPAIQYSAGYDYSCQAYNSFSPICQNPLACSLCNNLPPVPPFAQPGYSPYSYAPGFGSEDIQLNVDSCTSKEIQLSASYQTTSYTPMPSFTKKGYLFIKISEGITRKIPLTVYLKGVLLPIVPGMSIQYAQYSAISPAIPESYSQNQKTLIPEGYKIDLYINKFTFKGEYEYDLKLPEGKTILCKEPVLNPKPRRLVFDAGECGRGKIKLTAYYSPEFSGASGSLKISTLPAGEFAKQIIPGQPVQGDPYSLDIPITVSKDESGLPQAIQLLVKQDKNEESEDTYVGKASFGDNSFFEPNLGKNTCSISGISSSKISLDCAPNQITLSARLDEGDLTKTPSIIIKNASDFNNREIPIYLNNIPEAIVINLKKVPLSKDSSEYKYVGSFEHQYLGKFGKASKDQYLFTQTLQLKKISERKIKQITPLTEDETKLELNLEYSKEIESKESPVDSGKITFSHDEQYGVRSSDKIPITIVLNPSEASGTPPSTPGARQQEAASGLSIRTDSNSYDLNTQKITVFYSFPKDDKKEERNIIITSSRNGVILLSWNYSKRITANQNTPYIRMQGTTEIREPGMPRLSDSGSFEIPIQWYKKTQGASEYELFEYMKQMFLKSDQIILSIETKTKEGQVIKKEARLNVNQGTATLVSSTGISPEPTEDTLVTPVNPATQTPPSSSQTQPTSSSSTQSSSKNPLIKEIFIEKSDQNYVNVFYRNIQREEGSPFTITAILDRDEIKKIADEEMHTKNPNPLKERYYKKKNENKYLSLVIEFINSSNNNVAQTRVANVFSDTDSYKNQFKETNFDNEGIVYRCCAKPLSTTWVDGTYKVFAYLAWTSKDTKQIHKKITDKISVPVGGKGFTKEFIVRSEDIMETNSKPTIENNFRGLNYVEEDNGKTYYTWSKWHVNPNLGQTINFYNWGNICVKKRSTFFANLLMDYSGGKKSFTLRLEARDASISVYVLGCPSAPAAIGVIGKINGKEIKDIYFKCEEGYPHIIISNLYDNGKSFSNGGILCVFVSTNLT